MSLEDLAVPVVLGLLLLIFFGSIDRKLSHQKRQLDALLDHLGVSFPSFPPPSTDVLAILGRPDGKIPAIVQYRKDTGLGLADANAAVESFIAAGEHKRGV